MALGIDVVHEAVGQTRARGAAALRRDIFGAVPGEGRWQTALLADGNVGIGGDPVALLRRLRRLLLPGGRVVVEVAPPGVTHPVGARDARVRRRPEPPVPVVGRRRRRDRPGRDVRRTDPPGPPTARGALERRPRGLRVKTLPVPRTEDFPSRLRSAAVAARVGLWLGICFGVAFGTGLISHYAQASSQPVPFPTSPAWGYRVTQGLHVVAGTAAVPLLLVKLWVVYPRLFLRLPRVPREVAIGALERASIGILVAASVFQLTSGLANATQWYPWTYFSFRSTHYAIAWVAIGALLVHIAVKLPITRAALGADIDATALDRPTAVAEGPVSRRTLVRSAWLAAGVAVVASAASTVPGLRRIALLGSRTGDGPGGSADQHDGDPGADRSATPRGRRTAWSWCTARARRPLDLDALRATAAAEPHAADRLRRGMERQRDLDRRPPADRARPRRRAQRFGRPGDVAAESPVRSTRRPCPATSPTTTAPRSPSSWRVSRCRWTTAIRPG